MCFFELGKCKENTSLCLPSWGENKKRIITNSPMASVWGIQIIQYSNLRVLYFSSVCFVVIFNRKGREEFAKLAKKKWLSQIFQGFNHSHGIV